VRALFAADEYALLGGSRARLDGGNTGGLDIRLSDTTAGNNIARINYVDRLIAHPILMASRK
jgi:hypothetical protein